jgi:hypothetical protein
VVRTALFLVPAFVVGSLRSVLAGAVVFAGLRLAAMIAYFWREFGRGFRIDAALWRSQLAYALPFALAVGIEVVQVNYHQWVVAAGFDAATVRHLRGRLPADSADRSGLHVDLQRDDGAGWPSSRAKARSAVRTRCCRSGTTRPRRLASIIFPLAAVLMLTAHGVIVAALHRVVCGQRAGVHGVVPDDPAVGVRRGRRAAGLRADAVPAGDEHRPAAIVAGLIGWFISTWGLIGAVLVTLAGTSIVKAAALVRIAS